MKIFDVDGLIEVQSVSSGQCLSGSLLLSLLLDMLKCESSESLPSKSIAPNAIIFKVQCP